VLLFFVVFGFTIRSLVKPDTKAAGQTTSEVNATAEPHQDVASTTKTEASRGKKEGDTPEQSAPQPAQTTEIRPMATTTVTIDATTGLLARADCPSKTRMTYPAGNEPQGYCGANHQQKTESETAQDSSKTAKVKSATKKVITRLNGETKQEGWSRPN
jgi:hypothetical protein